MLSSTALMRSTALLSLAASAWAAATSYDVLSLFYRTTNGAQWHNNEGWLTGDPCDGTWMTKSKYDCYSGELTGSYQPICCDLVSLADTSPRVTKLDLFDNNLRGTIPKEIVDLSTIKLLALDGNHLSGTIPSVFGKLWNLNVLWLHHNSLSGSLPTELGKLTTFVQRGCYLQNNSFVYCPPVQSTTAGTGDTTSTTLQLPAECTTDGPASPTDWIGLGAIPCANASTGSGGGSTSTTAERKEYSTGGLYIILAVLGGSGTLVVLYELIYGEAGKGLPCRRKEDDNEEEEVQAEDQKEALKKQRMARWGMTAPRSGDRTKRGQSRTRTRGRRHPPGADDEPGEATPRSPR